MRTQGYGAGARASLLRGYMERHHALRRVTTHDASSVNPTSTCGYTKPRGKRQLRKMYDALRCPINHNLWISLTR